MNNELERHKTSDKIKWICTLTAFIIVSVMLIGIICAMAVKKDDSSADNTEQAFVTDSGRSNDGRNGLRNAYGNDRKSGGSFKLEYG